MLKTLSNHYKEIIALVLVLTVSTAAHAFNMFRFPYYENDEGVYISQAWSIVTQGKLAPYTYWYDHAPAGWMLIALWAKLTGGFFTFGASVNSGRMLMLVLHLASTVLLYYCTKKLTDSRMAGLVAALIFSLSPLGIYFQRRVLLDNIMTFWVLLSFALLLSSKFRLSRVILCAVIFGIGILTKESAIFFIPLFLYVIYIKSNRQQRSFTLIQWLAVVGLIVSVYFLYALLKREFFPVGFMGDNTPHVSLLTTLKEQYIRGGGEITDFSNSTFWNSMRVWMGDDPVIILLGAAATIVNLIAGIRYRNVLLAGLLSASYWAFLMRGGLVIEFYVIPLIPLLALNIAILGWLIGRSSLAFHNLGQIVLAGIIALSSIYHATNIRGNLNLYLADQTTPQTEAVDWMLSMQKPDAFFVIDNYAYVDLQTRGNNNFKNAEWYWKVDRDPMIRDEILQQNPEGISYIALTPQMEHDLPAAELNLSLKAWHASAPIARFWNDGWGVEFWATRYPDRILRSSWESYKDKFIKNGRVIDPYQNGNTTSEGQSYAMLRAVWMDDRTTFDAVWEWSTKHLQLDDSLFAWRWEGTDGGGRITDTGTAADADQDIALALLFAGKRWGEENYLSQAGKLLTAIWDKEVAEVNGIPYVTGGNWANHEDSVTINPSYLSPSHYRIFAEADISRPWGKLIDSSYRILEACTLSKLDKAQGQLPPEWCAIDKNTYEIRAPDPDQPQATEYSYNALRVPWRIALDLAWNKSEDASKYLKLLSFLSSEYQAKGRLTAAYQHDGQVWEDYETVLAYAGSIGYFQALYPSRAEQIYQEKILAKFYEDGDISYWEDINNYYVQNWAWLGTALYTDNLPNLWQVGG